MKPADEKRIRDTLGKNHACYVVITCGDPTEEGDMEIQMIYEGDPILASYLLEGAQSMIDEQHAEEIELHHG